MIEYKDVYSSKDFIEWVFSTKWNNDYDEEGNPKSKLAPHQIPPDKFMIKWISVIGALFIAAGGFFLGLGTATPPDPEIDWLGPMIQVMGLVTLLTGVWIDHTIFHKFVESFRFLSDRIDALQESIKKG